MKHRTIKQAVADVLNLVGHPLSLSEIYERIIQVDYYRFNAENPQNIVQTEVRRHCEGVDFPTAKPKKYFQILKDGTYWLKDIPVPGETIQSKHAESLVRKESTVNKSIIQELKEIHEKHYSAFKQLVLNQLMEVDPEVFEKFSRKLLEVYGFKDVNVTRYVKDGGIDGHGKLKVGITHLNVAFQCKRWKSNSVHRTEVDKFRGAIQGDFEQGIIFTTANFSPGASNATIKKGAVPVILIDGQTIVDIMIEKKFGVDIENIPVFINALDRVLTDEI